MHESTECVWDAIGKENLVVLMFKLILKLKRVIIILGKFLFEILIAKFLLGQS